MVKAPVKFKAEKLAVPPVMVPVPALIELLLVNKPVPQVPDTSRPVVPEPVPA